MKVTVILGQNANINSYDLKDHYLIGVDRGALFAIQNGIMLDLAIGDFDSVFNNDLVLVKKKSKEVITLNCQKDETDTAEALKKAFEISNDVTIIGGIFGKRIEHFIANINLLIKYPTLRIMDDNTCIYMIDKTEVFFKDEYKYISFFPVIDSVITLEGFKYPLNHYDMKMFDSIGISNEVIDKAAIYVESGKVLVIKSKNDIEK